MAACQQGSYNAFAAEAPAVKKHTIDQTSSSSIRFSRGECSTRPYS